MLNSLYVASAHFCFIKIYSEMAYESLVKNEVFTFTGVHMHMADFWNSFFKYKLTHSFNIIVFIHDSFLNMSFGKFSHILTRFVLLFITHFSHGSV